jgi:large subunit ribosomal protein L7/L12
VKALETKFGISAAMPMASAAAPAAEAAPAAAEKSEYKVSLTDAGAEKIKVIKALREVIPNLALSDAKKLTEETPAVIAESVSKADAEKMKKKLEEVGAKVELA